MISTRWIVATGLLTACLLAHGSPARAQGPAPAPTPPPTTEPPPEPPPTPPPPTEPPPVRTEMHSPERVPMTEAEESEDELSRTAGWNSKWALLFSLNNVLQVQQVLSEFEGLGLAGVYHMSPRRALRFGASLSRDATPQEVTQMNTRTGTDTVTTYTVTPGNSTHDIVLAGDYLIRFSQRKISPYTGAGAFFAWDRVAQDLDDDVSVADQRHQVKQADNNVSLGARGVFGIEWRIHGSFALFAEYSLTVPLIQWHSFSKTDTLTDTANNATLQTSIERKTSSLFNYTLGLTQGAAFGLAVLF